MNRVLQREQQAQVLKLFVSNDPIPDCVMFDFFKADERATDPIGIELKAFRLGRERGARRERHYQRCDLHILDEFPTFKLVFEDFLARVAVAADPARPVWLEFDRPKGDLPLIPWERLIAPHLPIFSILRWPYHLLNPGSERRAASGGGLDVIFCSSVPHAKAQFPAHEIIYNYVSGALAEETPHRFHVFVDYDVHSARGLNEAWSGEEVGTFQQLLDSFAAEIEAGRVFIYDPREAENYGTAIRRRTVAEGDEGIVSPWLQWMRDSLRAPSADLVHFLCHGYLASGRGSLAFAESPIINRDRAWARFVGCDELANFLDQTGAWSVGFSSPWQNFSEAALWSLADEIAEMRPGPVLVHDLPSDSTGGGLLDAFRLITGAEPQVLPDSEAITLYGHPDLIKTPDEISGIPEYTALLEKYGIGGNTSEFLEQARVRTSAAPKEKSPDLRWVAASNRIIEQRASEVAGEEAEMRATSSRSVNVRGRAMSGKQRALSFVADLLQKGLHTLDD